MELDLFVANCMATRMMALSVLVTLLILLSGMVDPSGAGVGKLDDKGPHTVKSPFASDRTGNRAKVGSNKSAPPPRGTNQNENYFKADHQPPKSAGQDRRTAMLRKRRVQFELLSKISAFLPSFTDIFDQETFFILSTLITTLSIVLAYVASHLITLKPVD